MSSTVSATSSLTAPFDATSTAAEVLEGVTSPDGARSSPGAHPDGTGQSAPSPRPAPR